MEKRVITALAGILASHVVLGKARLQTLALLVTGIISARTVNLSHVASERGASHVQIASTYRRLQRFFQHVRLAPDWVAPLIAGLAGGAEKRVLILDRTNWKIGSKHVNLLVLGVATRHSRFALMWIVLDRPGNSGAPERIALLERYIAMFGKGSIEVLLADREFIGADWINWLIRQDIPFVTRFRGNLRACRVDGIRAKLARLVTAPRKGRRANATLTGIDAVLHFAAKAAKGREAVITGTNRPDIDALSLYRKRWAIECFFGDAKTRGLNLEDTHLTDPAKLHLLTAIVALAVAWAARAARTTLGNRAPPRKSHGYLGKSYFRTGIDFIRNRLRTENQDQIHEWSNLRKLPNLQRVV